jgi:hypothetical protein
MSTNPPRPHITYLYGKELEDGEAIDQGWHPRAFFEGGNKYALMLPLP